MEGKLKLSVIVPKIMNDLSIEIQANHSSGSGSFFVSNSNNGGRGTG
jgi:hypothetical protein